MVGGSLLTVEEVAEWLRVHPQSVRRWLRAGELVGVPIGRGGAYRIRPDDVQSFLDARLGKPTLRRRPEDGAIASTSPTDDHGGE
jgi:excisionase family DNA binding protein